MKIKVTIWFEDPKLDQYIDSKYIDSIKNKLVDFFLRAERPIHQIEIEESDFED